MACNCSNTWKTAAIAESLGLSWRSLTDIDRPLIADFVERGGTGSPSIDKFAREELIEHALFRYANSVALLNASKDIVGFSSNSMGQIEVTESTLMGLNLSPARRVPSLFLHRIGTKKEHQRKGVGQLLIWRTFETLVHSCHHTAAAGVALLVDAENVSARKLYEKLLFQPVKTTKPGKELYFIPYSAAVGVLNTLP